MIEIKDKSKCCGCTACASICPQKCIEMKRDEEGFAYPVVDKLRCVECGLCEKACPILSLKKEKKMEQDAYVVQHKDEKVLQESTAGGAFSAIAKYVLQKKGVVFGVELSKDLLVRHIYVANEKELFRFRNSKYVQSDVGNTFSQVKDFLKQNRLVCYSGTPCQIEGLKAFLGKEYDNLITVDVVCRAVPSPLVFSKYLEYQEDRQKSQVLKVRFRDKFYGYKYSTMNITTEKNSGNYHKGAESDPWLRAFFSGICNRPSCYNCQFKKQYRESDFTIWDCFTVGRLAKEMDNDKGATRVLIHTDKGRKIFTELSRELCYKKISVSSAIEGVKELKETTSTSDKRKIFFDDANRMSGTELFNKYFPETLKTRLERMVRITCYRLGIYSIAKKIFVKITGKY